MGFCLHLSDSLGFILLEKGKKMQPQHSWIEEGMVAMEEKRKLLFFITIEISFCSVYLRVVCNAATGKRHGPV